MVDAMAEKLARPERFELPTTWFVARYSIQLSYGRIKQGLDYAGQPDSCQFRMICQDLAEREGFEPSMELLNPILP